MLRKSIRLYFLQILIFSVLVLANEANTETDNEIIPQLIMQDDPANDFFKNLVLIMDNNTSKNDLTVFENIKFWKTRTKLTSFYRKI